MGTGGGTNRPGSVPGRPALDALAATLGLVPLGPADGGEFGATFVSSPAGEQLVLKATADLGAGSRWAEGARLANVLRDAGYPCPRYVGTGTHDGLTWSLQQRLPGVIPAALTEAHLGQLAGLAERHAEHGRPEPWLATELGLAREQARWLEGRKPTRRLGAELVEVLDALGPVGVRQGDVAHGDFHHRNVLAHDQTVTGVFDWEGAHSGDWRFDLCTLAFWSELAPNQWTADAAASAARLVARVCPDPVAAVCMAILAARVAWFYATFRPSALWRARQRIERHVAQWWR